MSVGKRIYLKRELPDPEIVNQFKAIPASNTADHGAQLRHESPHQAGQ